MRRSLMHVLAITLALAFAVSAAPRRAAADEPLAGPMKADFKFGPSFGLIDAAGTQFRMQFDFGYNLLPASWGNLYLDLPLGIGLGNNLKAILFLPGIEADFLLPVGQPIYLYPKAGIGIGWASVDAGFLGSTSHIQFGLNFGGGAKYVLNGKWIFLFEPFNIEIYPVSFTGFTFGAYNLLFGAGMIF